MNNGLNNNTNNSGFPEIPVVNPDLSNANSADNTAVNNNVPTITPGDAGNNLTEQQNTINPDLNAGVSEKDAYVDEKLKSVEVNDYTPPSKGKVGLMIFFFIFLLLFVVFLPDISTQIERLKGGDKKAEEIVTGRLVCKLSENTVNLDKDIERVFNFTLNKLTIATFTTIVRGDPSEDEKELNTIAKNCNSLKDDTDPLSGIDITCHYSQGKVVQIEKFDFKTYNYENVRSAYIEAGGDIIEYEAGHDIDNIMLTMKQSGFVCNKTK